MASIDSSVVVFSLRALQARDPNLRNSKGLTSYMQISIGMGFIGIAQDLVNLLRVVLVKSTVGRGRQIASHGHNTDSSTELRNMQPVSPDALQISFAGSAGQSVDNPRLRFRYRRYTDILNLVFLAALVPGIIGNSQYKAALTDSAWAVKVMHLRYASTSVALFIILCMCHQRVGRLIKFCFLNVNVMASHTNGKLIDYSLYLVTGRDLLPPGKSYLESLEQSLKGGVKIVQIREKNVDTAEFLKIARESQILCKKWKVPIIINDRIDIALAMHADGVHLGQTDMPVSIARGLLPKGSIIGVSCNNVEQIKAAIKDRVDYVGIGAVWGTKTKDLTSPIIGVRGVGDMLNHLQGTSIKAVAIGGIKSTNLLRTLHGSVSTSGRALDGVAVVSDIVGSKDPLDASRRLCDIFREFRNILPSSIVSYHPYTPEHIKQSASKFLEDLKLINPLVHQLTNIVVANQSANATLALGASPIMATAPEEMEDLSHVIGSLLINFGTIKDKEGMLLAGHHANLNKKPVVFDPVGVGASRFRQTTADELLNTWQASVIKGNAGELAALAKSNEVKARGVDSVGAGFADPSRFVKQLALKERCVVVMTGPIDWVSDGMTVVRLENGHKLLADITGSGCMVGTCVAVFCAAAASSAVQRFEGKLVSGDMLCGAVGGVLALTIASELAAARPDVKGTGTFLPALIDELYNLTPAKIQQHAKIHVIG
ncbi:hypothetical protein HWV62_18984 [Athelia sp. TMB]|nr:hypothetical protein HWV62_18984 [Athelia sp. TMB]